MKEFFLMYDDVRLESSPQIGAARISAKHIRSCRQPGQMGPAGTGTNRLGFSLREPPGPWREGLDMRQDLPTERLIRQGFSASIPPEAIVQGFFLSLEQFRLVFRYLSKVTDGSYDETVS